MATKVSIKHTANDRTVTIYGEQTENGVYVWIGGGNVIGTYRNERFEGGLSAASLRNVLFGGSK